MGTDYVTASVKLAAIIIRYMYLEYPDDEQSA
jgi:hypothetical protein